MQIVLAPESIICFFLDSVHLTLLSFFVIFLLTGNRNGSEAAKFPFKSSTVRVAVVKKPVAAEGKKSAEAEDKKKQSGEEVQNSTKPDKSKTNATTNVLQSLCQYDSDDSDE